MSTNFYSSEKVKGLLICALLLILCRAGWADTHYVNIEGTLPTYPYTSWMTAANTIQEAVDAAEAGDTVMVYDGTYEVGGAAAVGDSLSNRVYIAKNITVMSENGPEVTFINGAGSLGSNAVRGVLLDGGAVLSGFVVTYGATLADGSERDCSGGGVLIADGLVTNCTIIDNSAVYGGGVKGGTVANSAILCNNAQFGGGAIYSVLSECYTAENTANFGGAVYECEVALSDIANNTAYNDGGAAYGGALSCCQIHENAADVNGGGTAFSTLDRCEVVDNTAVYGGGAYGGAITNSMVRFNLAEEGGGCVDAELLNCTVVKNDASDDAGGVYGGSLINSIVYDNYSYGSENHNYYDASMTYSCTEPALDGTGNISDNPIFQNVENGDFHLAIDSPCIDAGDDAAVDGEYDLNGETRIQGDAVDMGSYEYHYCRIDASASAYGTIDPSGEVYVRSGDSQVFTMMPKTYGVLEVLDVNGEYQEPVEEFTWESITEDGYIHAEFVADQSLERIHYVWTNSPSPEFPYASWDMAAHTIQDALDAAWDGAIVLVTNGVYNTGGARMEGHELFTRACITNQVEMWSVNGPEETIIEGEGPLGSNAVRGVFLTDGSLISGFTVRNGYTMVGAPSSGHDLCGGGILSWGGNIDHCILKDNTAQDFGGGAYILGAYVQNSIFEGNEAEEGGGLFGDGSDTNEFFIDGVASNCFFHDNTARFAGGGVSFAALIDCVVSNNYAGSLGGGVDKSPLIRCQILDNTAVTEGGGIHFSEWDITIVEYCVIAGNYAERGGGVSETIVSNSFLFNNRALHGAAAFGGSLNHCTVIGNTADYYAGGVEYGTVMNSIIYYNDAPQYPDNYEGSYSYCCVPDVSGTGNIDSDPQLIGGMHILSTSPCVGAANGANTFGLDIDGQAWAVPPSMGCDEPISPWDGKLNPEIHGIQSALQVGDALYLVGIIKGETASCIWDFDDGTLITNSTFVSHNWTASGEYTVSLTAYNETYPEGVSTSFVVSVSEQPVCYVWTNSPSPTSPYDTWVTAAHTIQDALDVAGDTYLVLVTNGVYNRGGCVGPGMSLTNRICATNAVTIQSVNGPDVTIICGGGILGSNAVRCAYLDGGAVLSGFTLTNGYTLAGETDGDADKVGGGALVLDGSLEQCIISGNAAYQLGGGLCGGSAYDCEIFGNTADSGGGASGSYMTNCVIRENKANTGGGAAGSQLCNCLIILNTAQLFGGGVSGGIHYSCTIYGNTAQYGGGGVSQGQYVNCIMWGNSAEVDGDVYDATINYCCVGNNPGGEGNLEMDPLFTDAAGGDFTLTLSSPCINAGNNSYVITGIDMNGDRRLQGGVVDMGVLEYTCYSIVTLVYGKGSIAGDEVIYAKKGESISIPITPDPYYHIASVLTNGVEAACTNLLAWNDVQADGVIAVTFSEDLAAQDTPCWWLAQYGWTDGFDDAALADQDGDGMASWKEYVAGTNPTNALSLLNLSGYMQAGQAVFSWDSVAGKQYEILYSTNGLVSWKAVTALTGISATPPDNTVTNTVPFETNSIYFRIKVQ